VIEFDLGDAVYAFLGQGQGAFAEFVVVDADAMAAKPLSLDFRAAAAVPLAGLTAWQGLFDHGRLSRGQRVLIHAAGGGVGHLAVQFAKACGAHVVATASGDAVNFVKALGADQVIDYKREPFESVVSDIDLVLDLVGGETQERSWQVLKRRGTLISTLTEPSRERAAETGIRVGRFTARPDGGQLEEIGALIDSGKVGVHVAQAFEFANVVEAEQRLLNGHIMGKMVLDLREGA
jgi:NADPH:quinone reductase-like Zn-dependent oxidoreductase